VVANILAGPLIDAASETAKIVSPTGHLILSGILDKQAVDVVNAHMAEGFTVVDQLLIDEWATLVLKSN
jgi:ribosomal protein L11 methyltransferase